MKKNIVSLSIIFLTAVFILNEINRYILEEKLSNIKYSDAQIDNFLLIGKNSDSFLLRGERLTERKDRILIDIFDLDYLRGEEKFKIQAEKGIYFKNRNFLKLIKNVKIETEEFILKTPHLNIYTDKRIAENNHNVILLSDKMITRGKGVFIDLKNEKMIIKNARTVFRGI
ncbi:LPS export ABC transporter periplasmic protein LptC [Persephonella sp.]